MPLYLDNLLPKLGADSPEDHGCGLRNGLQAFSWKIGVSVPEPDICWPS